MPWYLIQQFRQVVSGFAQKEIAPRAAEIDKTNRMPEVSHSVPDPIAVSTLICFLCRLLYETPEELLTCRMSFRSSARWDCWV